MLTVFLSLCILTPYLLYIFLANYLALSDRRRKSPIVHTNEIASALILGTALYYIGGYEESFDLFILPTTTHLAVTGYALLTEFEDLRYSLPQIKSWPWTMRVVVGTAILVIVLMGGLHVHYAVGLWGLKIALGGYLATFLILPLLAGVLCYALVRNERDSGIVGDVELELSSTALALANGASPILRRQASDTLPTTRQDRETERRQRAGKSNASRTDDEERTAMLTPNSPIEEEEDGLDALDRFDETASLRRVPPVPIQVETQSNTGVVPNAAHSPSLAPNTLGLGRTKLRIHLHHYQIFAYLALFCRFPTFWSRAAAGLVLGSMMHGLAAYGMDSLFEYVDDLA